MTKEQLQDIFRQPYNAEVWQELLINLFGVSDIQKTPSELTSDSNEKVEGFELGQLCIANRYKIGLFAFEIKKGYNLKLNRVGLRSLVKSYTLYNVDAALVVYYDDSHWRLSFICDLKNQKTDPKRYTYVFGNPQESYRTASAMLAKLSGGAKPAFEQIKAAFSVEALSKDFFKGYKEQYAKFCKFIGGEEKWQRDYVKKMMGRLVFLQFLQKKGWMGVPANQKDWDGGDLQYTQNLIRRYEGNEKLLSEIFEPLFFDTLNTKRDGDIADPKLGDNIKIPYLNGGLFDKDKLDEKLIDFPYTYFVELLDFFSQYNFTIDENDPNDAEMGIDPEMLGHIFENLLEDNKDKGAFYTPKEIVQYMCRQSLIEYLQSKLGKHIEIENFINNHDTGNRLDPKNFIAANAKTIEELLDNVKICDPAIGSGAFPMGVLNEIFHAKMALDMTLDRAVVKKNIIQNSIYGVDIEQGAVDIARLRFWLSLVVDEDEPQPLPNLDYKIMQGNSLLESFEGVDLSKFNEQSTELDLFGTAETKDEIKKLIKKYFAVTDHSQKDDLRGRIDEKVKEHIIKSCGHRPEIIEKVESIDSTNRPFFLWHVYFNDVFENGGFDIVIANPPYVRRTMLDNLQKKQLEQTYKSAYKQYDLYILFIERALQLLNTNGCLCYINPIKFFNSEYGLFLRRLIINNHTLRSVIDISQAPVFENALTYTCILLILKEQSNKSIIDYVKIDNVCDIVNLRKNSFSAKPQSEVKIDNECKIIFSGNNEIDTIISKINKLSSPLKAFFSTHRGLANGKINFDNHINRALKSNQVKAYKISDEHILVDYADNSTREKFEAIFNSELILLPRTVKYLQAAIKAKKDIILDRIYYLIPRNFSNFNSYFILAFVNSKLLNYWFDYNYSSTKVQGGYFDLRGTQIESIPLPKIEKESQQPIIEIVDKILDAKKADPKADTTALEAQIDTMVYALYNLTPAEITLIEKK